MEIQITINFDWSRNDGKSVKKTHREALEESAKERIFEMMKDGYTGGELSDSVRMDKSDGKNGIEYSGSWSIDTKVIN